MLHKAAFAILVSLFLSFAGSVFAHGTKVGDLMISKMRIRATPPGAPVSGGYMVIKNTGTVTDRITGISADFAGKAEIHEMKLDGDIMRMRPLVGGLEIPAGGEVILKPGGLHLMFMQLGEQLKEGDSRKVTLTFEKAGEVEVDFKVRDITKSHKHGDHSGHGDGQESD